MQHRTNHIMQRTLAAGFIVLLLSFSAQETFGQAAGAFSRVGFGARGMAMGNALASDVTGAASPYYNPALAPFTPRQNLQAGVAMLTFDRQLQFLQFSSALPPKAGIAASLIHGTVSDIDGRNESGYHTGNLSTDEFAVGVSFGLKLGEKASMGLGLQIFRSKLLDDLEAVTSVGIDLGMTLQIVPDLYLGLVADDLLARYSWDTSGLYTSGGKRTSDVFPRRLRAGLSRQFMGGQLLIAAEYEGRVTKRDHRIRTVEVRDGTPLEVLTTEELTFFQHLVRLGGEYEIGGPLVVRAGVEGFGDAMEGLRPTAGFRVEQPVGQLGVWIEYAFAAEPLGVGTMHFVTLRLFL